MSRLDGREHGAGLAHAHVVLGEHAEVVVAAGRQVGHGVVGLGAVHGADVHPVVALGVAPLDDVRLDARAAVRRRLLPRDRDRLDPHVRGLQVGRSSGDV